MNRKNKSTVWDYFKKVNSQFVKCNFCNQEYKHSGNTTNLRDHLKRKHAEKIDSHGLTTDLTEVDGSSSEAVPVPPKKSRSSIKSYFNRSNLYEANSKVKKELDSLYAQMIAIDMLPYRTSDHKGLKKIVQALDSRYELPDRSTLKCTLIPQQYDALKIKLEKALTRCSHLSITTDMWTSNANEGILALTCHFIQDEQLVSALLKVKKIEGHHNAEAMANAINDILVEYNIRQKVVTIVTDNAPAMKKTAEILKIRHSPCFAHCINLTVQDCFKVESFAEILSKTKAIVTFFHSSTLASDKLRIAQKKANKQELKLVQEVSTRWNISYFMLKRILEVRSELAIAINECSKAPSYLTAENFTAIEEIIGLLEPFEVATTTISGETYVTASLVIPLTRGISVKLISMESKLTTVEGRHVLDSLIKSVDQRLKPFYTRTINMISTVLDPRFKKLGFRTSQEADNAVTLVQREYASVIATSESATPRITLEIEASTSASSSCTSAETNLQSDDLLFLPNQQQQQVITPVSNSIIDLRQYLEKPVIEKHASILQYWAKSNNMLRVMANKYLCCTATSVPSERIFSKAGEVMNQKRNRLKDKNLNTLLFIQHNLDIFKSLP